MNCPRCTAPEVNPTNGKLFIRAFKIMIDDEWESHCMKCGCWFNESRRITEVCDNKCYCKEKEHAVS